MKIGKRVKAKKYKPLRDKQRQANSMLKEAKGRLKENHRGIRNTKKKIAQFYHSRGLKQPAFLSFKSLQAKDLKAYENLLDSIINDTYINKDKYNDFREKMKENYKQQNGGEEFGTDDEWDAFLDLWNNPIIDDLMEQGLAPSEFQTLYESFVNDNISDKEFIQMLNDFQAEFGDDDDRLDDFMSYAEQWKDTYLDYRENGDFMGFSTWDDYREEYLIYRG